tara:strand:- start:335 stop:2542 length:2208 start_codon:yes stop_codon:yes gene_type:complete
MTTYAGNPQGLMQRYSQTQEIVDLLALQQMKNDRAAATTAIQGAMQPPANTVKEQLEQEAMQGARNDVMRSMAPGIQQQGQRMAQMQPGGLPTQAAPNMNRMAQGGIVGYADGGITGDEAQVSQIGRFLDRLFPSVSQEEFDNRPRPGSDEGKELQYISSGGIPTPYMGSEYAERFREKAKGLGPVREESQQAAPVTPEQVEAFLARLKELNEAKANAFPQEKDMFQQQIQDLLNVTPTPIRNAAGVGMARGGVVGYQEGGGPIGANNPLNLRDYNQNWEGETGATDGFVDFEDEFSGVRAADKLLSNYGTREGIDTLRGAIARFAPPNENLTEDYISFVSERTGIPSEQPIDLSDEGTRRNILSAMAKMESGKDIDVVDVLTNDESRFGVTTDRGMSPEQARTQDEKKQDRGLYPSGQFADMTVAQFMDSLGKGTPTAEERARFEGTGANPYAFRDMGAGILNALSSTGKLFGSEGRRRLAEDQRRLELAAEYPDLNKSQINYLLQGEIGKGQIVPQKEADVPGIPGVLNDMPQPSDAQKFANSFPGAQAAVDQYAEAGDGDGGKAQDEGSSIDFRALREFLVGGAGQTSTAGALAEGARGLGAFQAAEQGRLDVVNKAAAELQLRRDLAVNESRMLDRRLLAEYQLKLTTEQLKIAEGILEQLNDPLSTTGQEYQAKAKEIREKYDRQPEAINEALRKLRDGYVQQGVGTVQRGAGLGSVASTSAAITDMGLE